MTVERALPSLPTQKPVTAWMRFLRQVSDALALLLSSRTALVGMTIVLIWVFIAILAPYITKFGPLEQDYLTINKPPSAQHILGTDHLGRDVWSRLAYGAGGIYWGQFW